MKKLAGATWGADAVTLKRLYTGRVGPVLEYGIMVWGTTFESNFNWLNKVQNQATCIITGAMKSTLIVELETITGLQSLDDRRDFRLIDPLLGAAWRIVYFLQGRLGMAANFTQAYQFICPAIVANVSGVNSR